jgi:uncharacterized protein YhbP (UPF0306 family)
LDAKRAARIDELLQSQRLLALGTVGPEGPSVCTVFFVSLEGALYFRSSRKTHHVAEAGNGKAAAAAIWDSTSTPSRRLGIQLDARLERLTDRRELARVVVAYSRAFHSAEGTTEDVDALLQDSATSVFYALRDILYKLHDSQTPIIDSEFMPVLLARGDEEGDQQP